MYSRNKEDSGKLIIEYHICGININGSSLEEEQSDKTRTETIDILRNREDDACEESWSDEEGEDPSYTYNYLRRRRYT